MSTQFRYLIERVYPGADILSTTRVLHHEWELDGWVALVNDDDTVFGVTTDHGGLVKMSLADTRRFVRAQIRDTQDILDEMKDFQDRVGTAVKS